MAAVMSYDRVVPVPMDKALDAVLPIPLEQLFARRYGPIPAIRGTVRAQPGWDAVGNRRTVQLADGGTLQEELTRVDRPHSFGYRLSEIRGPMRPLAASVDGLWTFEPAADGTRITWSWTMHPRVALLAPVLRLFARVWRGYARVAFDRLETLVPSS